MDWTLFLTFLAACSASAITGMLFQPGDWYDGLKKPSWTPARWVFPVTWTTLYILMSVAAARVANLPGSGQAMAFWALQMAFNVLWTPIFFGLRKVGTGMIVILALWVSVAATLWAFWQLDSIAGLLFVPYIIWVTLASGLNLSVLRLNGANPS